MRADEEESRKDVRPFWVFEGPRELRIEIPSTMKLKLVMMNCLGLLFTLVSFGLSAHVTRGDEVSLSGYLTYACGLLAFAATVGGTLYMLAGKTIITVDGTGLGIGSRLFGVGRNSWYTLATVSDLRYANDMHEELKKAGTLTGWQAFLGSRAKWDKSTEAKASEGVVFDYDGATRWLANRLKEHEAQALIAEIVYRYPQLARKREKESTRAAG